MVYFNIILTSAPMSSGWYLPVISFLQLFRFKSWVNISCLPCMLHLPLLTSPLIL